MRKELALLLKTQYRLILVNLLLLLFLTHIAGAAINIYRRSRLQDSKQHLDAAFLPGRDLPVNSVTGAPEVDLMQRQCFVTHPYLGYIDRCRNQDDPSIPYQSTSLKVLILGGSVGAHLSVRTDLEKTLNAQLAKLPKSTKSWPKKSIVTNASLHGYKQPQQLFALQFLLLQGHEFDYVINVNGFNELALTLAENYPKKVNLILPRLHPYKEVTDLEFRSGSTSSLPSAWILSFIDLIFSWHSLYPQVRARIKLLPVVGVDRERNALAMRVALNKGYRENRNLSIDDAFESALTIWKRSSRMTYVASASSGAKYFEYLQPNQYVLGTKKLTNVETKKFVNPASDYGRIISRFYQRITPQLLGIPPARVWDGRFLFKHEQRQLYQDDCCHLNSVGMQLMADDIADKIVQDIINSR